PRIILRPIKCHRHVILDVCTPTGSIERWVIPKSLGTLEYRERRGRSLAGGEISGRLEQKTLS
ncbi:unnamed protein product, partial [Tuber aestivum]